MRTLPPGLQAHLDSGATTLCWCWRITQRDGTQLGFTDHDRDLTFAGTLYEAATGFNASEIRSSAGLNVDDLEVESALVSERLSERALASGDLDEASVEIFRVNWQDTNQRLLMRKGSLGEVRRTGTSFAAEIRGLAHYLQQPKGRIFQFACDADVGDTRCGIDLSAPQYEGNGIVVACESERIVTASGLAGFADGWFTRGVLSITSGAARGRASEVKHHASRGGVARFELWLPVLGPPLPGDTFTVTVGCDRQHATCRDKFANATRYRGFPHMPGNDFLAATPVPGDATTTEAS